MPRLISALLISMLVLPAGALPVWADIPSCSDNGAVDRFTQTAAEAFRAGKPLPAERHRECTTPEGKKARQSISFYRGDDGKLHRKNNVVALEDSAAKIVSERRTHTEERDREVIRGRTITAAPAVPKEEDHTVRNVVIGAAVATAVVGGGAIALNAASKSGARKAAADLTERQAAKEAAYKAGVENGRKAAPVPAAMKDVPQAVDGKALGIPGASGDIRVAGAVKEAPQGVPTFTHGGRTYFTQRDPSSGLVELILINQMLHTPFFYPWAYWSYNPWMVSSPYMYGAGGTVVVNQTVVGAGNSVGFAGRETIERSVVTNSVNTTFGNGGYKAGNTIQQSDVAINTGGKTGETFAPEAGQADNSVIKTVEAPSVSGGNNSVVETGRGSNTAVEVPSLPSGGGGNGGGFGGGFGGGNSGGFGGSNGGGGFGGSNN